MRSKQNKGGTPLFNWESMMNKELFMYEKEFISISAK